MISVNRAEAIILDSKLVAIIRLANLTRAVELAQALVAGGVRALEFTLTNRDSIRAIEEVKRALPGVERGEITVGAGTVVTMDDLDAVLAAGAQFVVSPVLNLQVVAACRAAGVPALPGAYTPTEIQAAWDAGASFVKVFPARALGPHFIKDVLNALPHLRLVPTGGVDANNIKSYLSSGAAAVGLGGNLVDARLVDAQNWEQITRNAREMMALIE